VPHYPLFIMTGLFPWFWFASAVSESSNVLVSYGPLVKRVVFPRAILPLSTTLGNAAQFTFTLPVLLTFILVGGVSAKPMWLIGIPFLILLQFALTIGIGMALSALNVFFRDIAPLVDVALTMLFYASAVIFPLNRVPADIKPILLINPLTGLMVGWRTVLLDGAFPGRDIWPTVGLTVLVLALGTAIFRTLEKHFADAL
jgi:lipopolysaccharide transport system permease protein